MREILESPSPKKASNDPGKVFSLLLQIRLSGLNNGVYFFPLFFFFWFWCLVLGLFVGFGVCVVCLWAGEGVGFWVLVAGEWFCWFFCVGCVWVVCVVGGLGWSTESSITFSSERFRTTGPLSGSQAFPEGLKQHMI